MYKIGMNFILKIISKLPFDVSCRKSNNFLKTDGFGLGCIVLIYLFLFELNGYE